MSITMPAATAAVMAAAPPERPGLASGTFNAARQVGGVLGVTPLGSLIVNRASFASGLHIAMALAGAALLAGVALTAMAVERTPIQRQAPQVR
jgi:DHA2 family methylenomycin A resistance protein-like MFS transporter